VNASTSKPVPAAPSDATTEAASVPVRHRGSPAAELTAEPAAAVGDGVTVAAGVPEAVVAPAEAAGALGWLVGAFSAGGAAGAGPREHAVAVARTAAANANEAGARPTEADPPRTVLMPTSMCAPHDGTATAPRRYVLGKLRRIGGRCCALSRV
jgi:hypothetical protein